MMLGTAGCGATHDTEPLSTDTAVEDADEPDFVTEEVEVEETEESEAEEAEKSETAAPDARPEIVVRGSSRYDMAPDGSGILLLSGSFKTPVLSKRSQTEYPALAAALEKEATERMNAYTAEADEYLSWAIEEYEENGAERFEYMNYSDDYTVVASRVDQRIVSFFYPFTDYTGGAHGMYGQTGVSFDAMTGEKLKLSDVLTDLSGLQEMLKTELLAEYGDMEDMFDDLDRSLSHYDVAVTEETADDASDIGYIYPYDWALSTQGIEFYFGPYQLTAYAGGAQQVTLTYEKYPELFVEKYVPDSDAGYLIAFDYALASYDIDGDGKADEVSITRDYEGDGFDTIESLGISTENGADSFTDLWIDGDADIQGYLLRTADGRSYVYLIAPVENDYERLFVFDLTSGTPKAVGEQSFVRSILSYNDDGSFEEILFTDVERMPLVSRFDYLCSFDAVKTYHPGDDGLPVSDDPWYTVTLITAPEPLVAKTELTASLVDEDGKIIGEETITSGDTFEVYRTDGESWLDVKLSDGRIIRLPLTETAYPCEIDGITDSDFVEQTWYVG